MNGAEVSILKQTNKISLSRFLQCRHGGALETEISLEILSDLTNQTLEREFADEEFSALLVLADLTESDGSRPETVRFLHSAGGRSRFASGFCSELLPWRFASGGFASGLLGTCHC